MCILHNLFNDLVYYGITVNVNFKLNSTLNKLCLFLTRHVFALKAFSLHGPRFFSLPSHRRQVEYIFVMEGTWLARLVVCVKTLACALGRCFVLRGASSKPRPTIDTQHKRSTYSQWCFGVGVTRVWRLYKTCERQMVLSTHYPTLVYTLIMRYLFNVSRFLVHIY